MRGETRPSLTLPGLGLPGKGKGKTNYRLGSSHGSAQVDEGLLTRDSPSRAIKSCLARRDDRRRLGARLKPPLPHVRSHLDDWRIS